MVAARSMLTTGALVKKYMLVAPKSTTPVVFVWGARWRRVWDQFDLTLLMSSKGECVVFRLGLKLAV